MAHQLEPRVCWRRMLAVWPWTNDLFLTVSSSINRKGVAVGIKQYSKQGALQNTQGMAGELTAHINTICHLCSPGPSVLGQVHLNPSNPHISPFSNEQNKAQRGGVGSHLFKVTCCVEKRSLKLTPLRPSSLPKCLKGKACGCIQVRPRDAAGVT